MDNIALSRQLLGGWQTRPRKSSPFHLVPLLAAVRAAAAPALSFPVMQLFLIKATAAPCPLPVAAPVGRFTLRLRQSSTCSLDRSGSGVALPGLSRLRHGEDERDAPPSPRSSTLTSSWAAPFFLLAAPGSRCGAYST